MLKYDLFEKFGFRNAIKVLDHGHVFLVDFMGDDEAIERAARVSYQKGTRQKRDTEALIRYLMRHHHTSPFEQCVITLDMKMPIFVARQFVRHRTQSLNEISGRYSELPEEFYVPDAAQICYQTKKNKQGRAEAFPATEADAFQTMMTDDAQESFRHYRDFLDADMARETARINLPLSTYTQWQTTMNLHNLFHFLKLRLNSHAQWEAQQYASAILKIVNAWVPIAASAWLEYSLGAKTFSLTEMGVLTDLARKLSEEDFRHALSGVDMSEREIREFLEALGVSHVRHRSQ
jgi:thymidylate synthase (FAD)